MQKIKAVIFDLDGTIADTIPLCIQAFRRSIEPLLNRPVSDAEISTTFGPSEEGTIKALVPDHYEKGLADYLKLYEALHDICPVPFAGIEDVLIALKNKHVRIAMVTGKGKYCTDLTLQKFGLSSFFEIIETGQPSGPSKEEGIQKVLDYFENCLKCEIVYIGDTPGDIVASKKVGISILSAAWAKTAEPEKLKALKPDGLFYSIEDLTEWLMERT